MASKVSHAPLTIVQARIGHRQGVIVAARGATPGTCCGARFAR